MPELPESELERYRCLLRLRVRQVQLSPRLKRRFDSSDVVQEALLKAHDRRATFRGTTEAELVKWLQEILDNTLADEARKARAQKRDVALEQSLEVVLEESSAQWDAYLTDNRLLPSHQIERQEMWLRISGALDKLPQDQ